MAGSSKELGSAPSSGSTTFFWISSATDRIVVLLFGCANVLSTYKVEVEFNRVVEIRFATANGFLDKDPYLLAGFGLIPVTKLDINPAK